MWCMRLRLAFSGHSTFKGGTVLTKGGTVPNPPPEALSAFDTESQGMDVACLGCVRMRRALSLSFSSLTPRRR